MVGLLIILGLGGFVLAALLYGLRGQGNHEATEDIEPHLGYRVAPSNLTGLGLPLTTRSPVDLVYTTELDADRALRRAVRESQPDEEHGE